MSRQRRWRKASNELDLATAMAISGAAASANMGANTIKPLIMTLALLNVRLGFWLPNPRVVAASKTRSYIKQFFDQFYFYYELRGELNEERDIVYVTDGGHVENLGVYELLRRRCRLIIAVDAEADPTMSFPSLMRLERIARIDFGVDHRSAMESRSGKQRAPPTRRSLQAVASLSPAMRTARTARSARSAIPGALPGFCFT